MVRNFIVVFVALFCFKAVKAQNGQIWPVGSLWYELDTSLETHWRNNVQYVVDSIYTDGKLTSIKSAELDTLGRMVGLVLTNKGSEPDLSRITIGYNEQWRVASGVVEMFTGGKLVSSISVNVTKFSSDGIPLRWEESNGLAVDKLVYTEDKQLEWKFIDTKAKQFFNLGYSNRQVWITDSICETGKLKCIIYFRDKDTLLVHTLNRDDSGNEFQKFRAFLGDFTSYSVLKNGRVVESKTFREGDLVEHHSYIDTVSNVNSRVCYVYDRLSAESLPELVITYGKTTKVVKAGALIYSEVNTQSSTGFVDLDSPPPPPAPETIKPNAKTKSRQDVDPLNSPAITKAKFKQSDGTLRYEYYNFNSLNPKPLAIIIVDQRGIVKSVTTESIKITRTTVSFKSR
ncbi:MAG: hypothetical protein L6Q81_08370 [Bacteroidia bacterium]|nr:hypothetical protein [Bacteroidia bacterium]